MFRVRFTRGVEKKQLTIIKRKGVTHLVEQNVNVIAVETIHKVLTADTLAPVATSTAGEAISQPERLVVVTISTGSTAAVVAVLVEEAAARLGTLRDALAVGVGVDLDAVGGALEEALVLDGPADDVDLDVLKGEVVVAVQPLEPLLVGCLDCRGNLFTLSGCDRR